MPRAPDLSRPLVAGSQPHPVQLLTINHVLPQPIVGIVQDDLPYVWQWNLDGTSSHDGTPTCLDLRNAS